MPCNVMYARTPVCLSVCRYVCMYVSLHFPFAPQYFPPKTLCFQRFRKDDVQKHRVFQIFGKRMQEAQASKKAGRGHRAWDPCFATPGPRRLRLVERHQIPGGGAPPPPTYQTSGGGGVRGGVRGGGGYPLSSLKCLTRRAMSADIYIGGFLFGVWCSLNKRPPKGFAPQQKTALRGHRGGAPQWLQPLGGAEG